MIGDAASARMVGRLKVQVCTRHFSILQISIVFTYVHRLNLEQDPRSLDMTRRAQLLQSCAAALLQSPLKPTLAHRNRPYQYPELRVLESIAWWTGNGLVRSKRQERRFWSY